MSGELLLAISCGAVLVFTGVLAYIWARRDYNGSASDGAIEDDSPDPIV